MGNLIKMKLSELRLTQAWLLRELEKQHIKVSQEELSRFINGKKPTPKCETVLEAAYEILNSFEQKEKNKFSN